MTPTRTVFVVDDDLGALRATRWLLESAGFEVEAYISPHEFLRQYDPLRAGCVIIDLIMREMNGIELERELAARSPRPPVILLTGSACEDPRVERLAGRVFGMMEKPGSPEKLVRLVREALQQPPEAV